MDSHAHLQHEQFDADRDAVIDRAAAAGIERILVPGWDLRTSELALELAERHDPILAAAVGVHPHHAAELDEAGWARLESLVADSRVRAVGEIGLDFFRNLSPPGVQRDALRRQLALADRHGLPVLVHDRDAHEAVTDELLAWQGQGSGTGVRGVLHAFSGSPRMAALVVSAGLLVSLRRVMRMKPDRRLDDRCVAFRQRERRLRRRKIPAGNHDPLDPRLHSAVDDRVAIRVEALVLEMAMRIDQP